MFHWNHKVCLFNSYISVIRDMDKYNAILERAMSRSMPRPIIFFWIKYVLIKHDAEVYSLKKFCDLESIT